MWEEVARALENQIILHHSNPHQSKIIITKYSGLYLFCNINFAFNSWVDDTIMTDASKRIKPNILVTGTPCVGKTATASLIAEKLHMEHVNVGNIIHENKCHLEFDEQLHTHVLDEDKLLDIMETKFDAEAEDGESSDDESNFDQVQQHKGGIHGNLVADYHACELFPERWYDLIIVLRAETHVLYDRLKQRGYSEHKISQNVQSEIMRVVLDEAKESYASEIVVELTSNSIEEMEQNVERVAQWYNQWIHDHANSS